MSFLLLIWLSFGWDFSRCVLFSVNSTHVCLALTWVSRVGKSWRECLQGSRRGASPATFGGKSLQIFVNSSIPVWVLSKHVICVSGGLDQLVSQSPRITLYKFTFLYCYTFPCPSPFLLTCVSNYRPSLSPFHQIPRASTTTRIYSNLPVPSFSRNLTTRVLKPG